MKVEYVVQPDNQLGRILLELLETSPKRVVFVSAFVSLQTIMRIKDRILHLLQEDSQIRFVLGIDLGGTSQEVLKELLGWNVDVCIVKHRIPRHTFHPKLYVFEWENNAEILIGSNNITEGGFFGNYEGSARIKYKLPDESEQYQLACTELARFINPSGPIAYNLNEAFLRELISRYELPTETQAQRSREELNTMGSYMCSLVQKSANTNWLARHFYWHELRGSRNVRECLS